MWKGRSGATEAYWESSNKMRVGRGSVRSERRKGRREKEWATQLQSRHLLVRKTCRVSAIESEPSDGLQAGVLAGQKEGTRRLMFSFLLPHSWPLPRVTRGSVKGRQGINSHRFDRQFWGRVGSFFLRSRILTLQTRPKVRWGFQGSSRCLSLRHTLWDVLGLVYGYAPQELLILCHDLVLSCQQRRISTR